MSYDIQVYSVLVPSFDGPAFKCASTSSDGYHRTVSGKEWHVVVSGPDKVEEEDLPIDAAKSLPGLQHLTTLHIEPATAPKSAYKIAQRIAKELAKLAQGVIVDQQADTISSPRGIKRLSNTFKSENSRPLSLYWLFMDVEQFRDTGWCQLFDLIEGHLPELLPRRYGPYEPPQFKWEVQGRSHFMKIVADDDYRIVWYPYKPATYVGMGVPDPPGPHKLGFRAGYFQVDFSDRVLDHLGWDTQLLRFFLRVSSILRPFYAEIRGGDSIPGSWWWKGIPDVRGRCTLIGPPYLELWSEFDKIAEHTPDGFAFIDSFTSTSTIQLGNVPAVPIEIAHCYDQFVDIDPATGDVMARVISPSSNPFSKVWPFDGPLLD